MVKRTFCDMVRILHHPAGISELDFGDCYDRMAHPPTSLALQSFGVPRKAVKVLLQALQLMQFCLRTGFGESRELFEGTDEDSFNGSGQGSG